jgi:glucosyl-dolichyl phosphate glucuronosyltransferase
MQVSGVYFASSFKNAIFRVSNTTMQNALNKPKLSVIICTRNPSDDIRQTLLSIKHQSLNTNDYEVIVVDSASDSARTVFLQQLCESHGFSYSRVDKSGLSLARNRGISLSKGEFIYFIDDDAIAPAHILAMVIEHLEQTEDRMVVGGPVHGLWSDYPPSWLMARYWRMISLLSYGDTSRPLVYPEIVIGCNMAFRKSVFATGLSFDESLGRNGASLLGGEERLMQKQLMDNGKQVYYVAEMYVFHRVPARRMTLDYILERAQGSELSRIAMEGDSSLWREVLRGIVELSIMLVTYPLHIFKFGYRSGTLKLLLVLAGIRTRLQYRRKKLKQREFNMGNE